MKAEFSHGDAIQLAVIQKISGERRVEIGAGLYEMTRQIISDGIRQRHPALREPEVAAMTRDILAPWYKKTLSRR